jgi:molybdate transport system substrate-binding protein
VTAFTALLLAACGSPTADPAVADGPRANGTVTVAAAASLTGVMRKLGTAYEKAHPGSRVRFTFAGSASLAQQVVARAPIDVLATASDATMRTAVDAGRADGEPAVFARNALEIAVPVGNPARVASLGDLGRPGVKLAVCAAGVPCGDAADESLRTAGVDARPVTRERDVKAVLTKVQLGEVDAGIVYRTDVRAAAGKVQGVPVPAANQVRTECLIAVVRDAADTAAAREFVDLVRSADGRAVLREAGFELP